MKSIKYFKAEPTEFARVTTRGKVKKEGTGITCIYLPFRTSIELISTSTRDQPLYFTEYSEDNQEVNVQGGILFSVEDPKITLNRYNFSIDPGSKMYQAEDPERLPEHITQIVQNNARRIIQNTKLEKIINIADTLTAEVTEGITSAGSFGELGLHLSELYFSAIRPKPEIAKGLEAEYREALLQREDEAVFARRALAVEKERSIRENELSTEIGLEQRRSDLVDLKTENEIKEAEAEAEAARRKLAVYDDLSAGKLAALGVYELGRNADRIETFTVTPEILASFMQGIRTG